LNFDDYTTTVLLGTYDRFGYSLSDRMLTYRIETYTFDSPK